MTVAEQLVCALERLGTSYVFGLPGSTEAALLDALVEPRAFEYVLTLHENVTVAMGDGYARGTGGPGIVNLHTSVGTANGLSQLYNAYRDGTPLVVLAGHKSTALQNRDGFCVVEDLPGMARPFTKWSGQVLRPEQAVDDLYRSLKVALSPPSGPVYLALPEDLLAVEAPAEPDLRRQVPKLRARPDRAALAAAAELLARARRPVLIAGDEVSRSGATDELAGLAEQLGAVVLREPRFSATRLNFPTNHPHYAGEYSVRHPAVQTGDVLFAVGCRLFIEFAPPAAPEVPTGVPLIHLHSDPREIGKLYPVAVGLVGDCLEALKELRTLIGENDLAARAGRNLKGAWVTEHRDRYLAVLAPEATGQEATRPMPVGELVKALRDVLPSDTILVDEGIRSSGALLRQYPFKYADSYHCTSGGALGWGLPAAVGLQLAKRDRRVVAFVGDGSALFTIQTLWTANRYRLPVVFLIVNNRGYLAVKAAIWELGRLGRQRLQFPGAAIRCPDVEFVSLAEGFGVRGRKVSEVEQLRSALRAALEAEAPYLLDVVVAEEPV